MSHHANPEPEGKAAPARPVPLFRDFVSGPWKEAYFDRYKPSTRKTVRSIALNRRPRLTRFLSTEELRRLHGVLNAQTRQGDGPQADIVRLLLLTGCRRSEIINLRRSEVRADALILEDSKTGPRRVPLNAAARRILERQPRYRSPYVFPSPLDASRPRSLGLPLWNRVRRDARIEDVRLHDLRHTMASHAVMNGVPVPVVSRLLGHSNVRMTLRYAHLADRDIEAAAERTGQAIAHIMGSRGNSSDA